MAFKLETKDSMDKVYSYLFYRVIQRAKNITFIYNTNSSISSKGERSRFIKQLESESKFTVNNYMISDKLELIQKPKMFINKTDEIIELLENRFFYNGYISPSGVKDYMDCSLRFYYKYISNIRETNEFTYEINKPDFGKITHKALEIIYSDIFRNNDISQINLNDFFVIKNSISGAIKKVIKSHFKLSKKNNISLEGNNIILNQIMEDYISRIISLDEKYAPFKIFSLEGDKNSGYIKKIKISKNFSINISGIIDRIDIKNNTYRIIDYKTGGDSKKIKDLENLFSSEKKERNDAVFQLLFYSLLLKNKVNDDKPIVPGLMNIREINNKKFTINISIGKNKIDNINNYLKDFEILLSKKLSEIYDKNLPFTETEDKDNCKFCAYKNLCGN
jgi:CRISPR/Cas system-associated exonuclease Cas4 (RecB family)